MHGGPFWGLLLLDCKSFFIVAQIYGRTLLPEVPFPFRSVTEHDWWRQSNSCLLLRSLSCDCSNTLCWQMCFPRNSISETEVIDQTPSGCSIMCKLLLKAERLQGRWCVLIADIAEGSPKKKKSKCNEAEKKFHLNENNVFIMWINGKKGEIKWLWERHNGRRVRFYCSGVTLELGLLTASLAAVQG